MKLQTLLKFPRISTTMKEPTMHFSMVVLRCCFTFKSRENFIDEILAFSNENMVNSGLSQSVTMTQPEVNYFLKREVYRVIRLIALRKTQQFHLISWCGYISETQGFRRVSGDPPCVLP